MAPDSELLRLYAEKRDEAAFAEVVHRHLQLVYASALRLLNGNATMAQDVTQTVFTDLARKAAPLSRHETVAGWLHTSVRYAATKAMRDEACRIKHEHEASAMNDPTPANDPSWAELRPLLDEAVGRLDRRERDAVLLRFFEDKSYREVGAVLGLNENTARMRVERALEKLRGQFARRGVTVGVALLASTFEAQAANMPVPPEFAATVVGHSLAGATTAGAGGVAAGLGLGALLMSKTQGIIISVVVMAIIAALALSFPRFKTPSPTPGIPLAAASAPVRLVVPPSVPSVPVSTVTSPPAIAVTNPQPQADLNGSISQSINLLKANDIPGLMKTLGKPEEWDEWRAEASGTTAVLPGEALLNLMAMATPEQLRQVMQEMNISLADPYLASLQRGSADPTLVAQRRNQMMAKFLQDLQQAQGRAPDWTSPDGSAVRFSFVPGDVNGGGIRFDNVDGHWYLYGPNY